MSQLILNRGIGVSLKNLRKILLNFPMSPYFLIISLIFFVTFITILTLISATDHVTKGYVLNSLEADQQKLLSDGAVGDLQISKVRSLNYIQGSAKVRRMVKPDLQVYMENKDSKIASR